MLSHDLNAFLVEFSVSLHKHAMYPPGHPSLGPAAERLAERAARLLEDRPMLAFGVARYQLIIDGVATDPGQPVLRRLAETLHRHHLGAISMLPGVEGDEFSGALHALADEVGSEYTPALGLMPPEQLPTWPHLRLHPLTLERLELIEDEGLEPDDSDGRTARRGAQLWVGLANAAMAMDSLQAADVTPDPSAVAKAIDARAGAAAYDQVIVGHLLQIAEELKAAGTNAHGALRSRTARLIAALQPETLERLVTMGGNASQRRAFVLGATSGMATESVVKILKAAADASGQTISHGLVRMLSKLATHAESGREQTRPLADGALREQVDQLLEGWHLDDPSPDAYSKTLQHLATTGGPGTGRKESPLSDPADDTIRIVQTSLEVAGTGPLVDRAVDRAISRGAIKPLLALLAAPPAGSHEAVEALRSKLNSPKTIAKLVSLEPLDFDALDALLPTLTLDGYEVLLDTLTSSNRRATRRRLLERLAPTNLSVTPFILSRLADERWYVQRNLLLLLEKLKRIPPGFSAARWTRHEDPRVRYQAISLQLTMPLERDIALRAALDDRDPRIIRLGLSAAQKDCHRTLISRVAIIAGAPHLEDELRILAVRTLGNSRDPAALDTLLRLVQGGKNWIGRPKLAPRTPVVVAALRALANVWSASPDASRMLTLARRSSDRDLRDAAQVVRI